MAPTYDAFISYSHAADGKLAPALQNALQRFAKPWYKLRALHLFRDQTSLSASPGLWPAIEAALQNSRYFLLLASPEAAQSRWVQQEVAWWLEHKSPDTLLIGLTDGKITREEGAKDFAWDETTALPPNLKGVFTENPLWVDFRWANGTELLSTKNPEFQNALAALAAPLRGIPKEDLIGEDVEQHRRALLLARGAGVVLVLLLIAAIGAALFARSQQIEAETQRNEAVAQRNRAEEQSRISLIRALAAQAATETERGEPERGALLARQAYLFSQDIDATVRDQVDASLRAVLGAAHFSRVLGVRDGSVTSAAFSPDGRSLVTGGCSKKDDHDQCIQGEIVSFDPDTPGSNPVVLGHLGRGVVEVAFSPDGMTIAAAHCSQAEENRDCVQGEILLFDPAMAGSAPAVLGHLDLGVVEMAFSPDRRTLAAVGPDGAVRLWDYRNPSHLVVELPGLDDPLLFNAPHLFNPSISFSQDGRTLAVSRCAKLPSSLDHFYCGQAEIQLFDVGRSEVVSTFLLDQDSRVTAVAFSPDGQRVFEAVEDGTIRMWPLARPNDEPIVLPDHIGTDPVFKGRPPMAFSQDGGMLAAGGMDGTTRLWDLERLSVAPVILRGPTGGGINGVYSLAFDSSGRTLATTSDDGSVRLWDLGAPASAPLPLFGHENRVISLAFSPDGRTLVSGVWPGTAREWDLTQSTSPGEVNFESRYFITSVALGPTGRTLAADAGGSGSPVLVWYLEPPSSFVPFLASACNTWGYSESLPWPGQIAQSLPWPAQRLLSWGCTTARIGCPDGWPFLSTWVCRLALEYSGSGIVLAFSPNGHILAAAAHGQPGAIRLWDLGTPDRVMADLPDSTEPVYSLAFSPDGRTLAAGSEDGTIRLWDISQPTSPPTVLSGHEHRVASLAFSPNGRTLASVSWDSSVRLWDMRQPNPRSIVLADLSDRQDAVAFSPDGNTLATAGYDNVVRLWDPNRPEAVPVVLQGQEGWITSLAFSPDGEILAVGSSIGPISLWRADTEALADMVCTQVWHNLTLDEWRRFVGDPEDVPYQSTCPNLPPGDGVESALATPA